MTPAVAIENGSISKQRRCITELEKLATMVEQEAMQAPVLFVIGRVVTLANELEWYVTHAEVENNYHAAKKDMQA
ncbi:MAG: hypothetical protein OQK73_13210 [Gammaproteobacteria bacterium]|nr:hypothetical protein [Gammaproteobacteria bacterium]